MSLVTLRDAVAARVAAGVSALADVHTHGGRFDAEELRRWATRAPCAVVGVLGVPQVALEGGQLVAEVHIGCFIVTRDRQGLPRDVAALALLESTLAVVRPEERWGDERAHVVERVAAENLFSGKLDNQGVAIWAVTWRQGYEVSAVDAAALPDFNTCRIDYAQPTETTPATADTVALPGAGGET